MKKLALVALVFLGAVIGGIIAVPAQSLAACAIHTWNPGDTFRATDLNSGFSCINGALKGSGFTLITSGDIAVGALTRANWAPITTVPASIWTSTTAACTSGTCTALLTSGQLTVTHTGPGAYSVAISPARADTTYWPTVVSNGGLCTFNTLATSSFNVACVNLSNAPTDEPFAIYLYDDE